ncbi:MAG: hypothetical protein DELT_01696 [Desulfovibrio sp.]
MPKKERRKRTDIAIAVGRAIAEQRKLVGLTQPQVAERMGVEKETVSRLETGTISQTVEGLQMLSEALNCPITRFFWQENEEKNVPAATIADMLDGLPAERQKTIVECVAMMIRALQK